MRAEIITIGDELLIGQVVDTNSAWMAEKLNEIGVSLYQITSVHDDRMHILTAIQDALERADIVLLTGGLGPTKDDITKNVLCEYFHTSLVENDAVRQHVMSLYENRPEVLNRLTATQWLVPQEAVILPNRVGSAPLMVFRKGEKILASMPGVPYEMMVGMEEQVLPYLTHYYMGSNHSEIIHRTILVSGISESALAIRIDDWENQLPHSMHLAYLPKDGTIRLRLSTYGEATAQEMERQIGELVNLIAEYVVAMDDTPLEVHIGELLKQRHQTIATAESCTGGRLAALLNKHAGSSTFYMGSVIAYSNTVKEKVLGVSAQTLQTAGAVSEETVKQMAIGVRKLLGTDYAIATSGIAGPDGGSEEKPIGTVWIAWASKDEVSAECFHLGKLREQITDRACVCALIGMLKHIK